ncbi:hypothetical protein ABL78_6913 [Leptomonas seymouri]|uniref:Uncharacterized protein n=1 Tax=Leptomonas seymouri TaxID=5684 RepID=A0A0N0P3E4_LEPSE|nr:hypothetical protein ABL78_6913 [Leptomonas seymouri]|eukprot:KPI84029.1 hypothetical protein ABL78_6913 [Leptomonas seymouri]
MSHNSGSGPSTAGKPDIATHPPRVSSRVRAAWAQAVSFLTPSAQPLEPSGGHSRGPLQQQQQQQQAHAGALNSTASSLTSLQASNRNSTATPNATASVSSASPYALSASSPTAAMSAVQIPGSSCIFTAAVNAVLNGPNDLDLMRTYDACIRSQKPRWRSAIAFLFAFLFFFYCTFRVPRGRGEDGYAVLYGGSGSAVGGSGGGGNVGGIGIAPGRAGTAGAVGHGAMVNERAESDVAETAEARHRYFEPLWPLRALFGYVAAPGRLDMKDVEWWAPSNRTTENSDLNSERGLNVGMPHAASLSLARSRPPWSADRRTGPLALFFRTVRRAWSLACAPERPSYDLALSAFLYTRQAMTEGSCNRCQARLIDQEMLTERLIYRQFLRENKLRVPLLLYYNRLPVYAMMQYLRLMRVRNYQLLDFLSREDAVLQRPETVANGVLNDAALHARELDFELNRLSFVFYLQRLHLRALRHSDAMRLETLHFLRHLSSAVPTLRQIWKGQNQCNWPGVVCVVVRVPLNLLVDYKHPAVHAFAADLFSVCRGPDCRQRRCIPPSCGAYAQLLAQRLFTSAAPGYWMKWDRMDDTAAMDEMVFPKAATRKNPGVDAAAASQQPPNAAAAGAASGLRAPWGTPPVGSTNSLKSEREGAVHGNAATFAKRASHSTTIPSRTVWSEQRFAYEHPNLLLADPLLLVDVDVKAIMEDVVATAIPPAQAANMAVGDHVNPTKTYRAGIERPLVEDLLPMQEKLLRTIAEAAPRGLRFGKQSNHSSTLAIPFTFVSLNLRDKRLRGYLPDIYDTQGVYDISGAAASMRANSGNSGTGSTNEKGNDSGRGPGEYDNVGSTSQHSTMSTAAAGTGTAGGERQPPDVRIEGPHADVYWGRLSRQRMLETRNVTTARAWRSSSTMLIIASEVQRALRRVERIGVRKHHEDLAAYFSEVSALALFQNERWSPYRWPEAMITITNVVSQSAAHQLYSIIQKNALSADFTTPVNNVDHHVEVFGELNPRLIALISVDVSANPLLSHTFPLTWLSIPSLRSVYTHGSSILAPPIHMRPRFYNESLYCSARGDTKEAPSQTEDARRIHEHRLGNAAGGDKVTQKSTLVRNYIGSELIPPYLKIDKMFSDDASAFVQQAGTLHAQYQRSWNPYVALRNVILKRIGRL